MRLTALCSAVFFAALLCAHSATLEEAYDRAGPGSGYDKYVVLETGVVYEGGLWIGGAFNRIIADFEPGGMDVRIKGNGAILDLKGSEICIAYCTNRLDIDDCVIKNGNIRFRGYSDGQLHLMPEGSVRYITFYKPHDYGVKLTRCHENILVERNILVDALDTGPDFQYLTGFFSDWMPTGGNVSLSILSSPSTREVYENWSYHSDPQANLDPLRHFNVL